MSLPMPALRGSVACRASEVGGGRGVFATADIPAGALVMAEEPLLAVSAKEVREGETWHFAVARTLLQSPRRAALLEQVASLHPKGLAALPAEARSAAEAQQAEAARQLEAAVPDVDVEQALLLLLKVQMNVFESGIYIELALVNHASFPNCLKFGPGERRLGGGEASYCSRSEIVAVRDIRAGEEVTISFLGACERSASARAALFREQHLVDLANLCSSDVPQELEALLPQENEEDAREAAGDLARLESALDAAAAVRDDPRVILMSCLELEEEASRLLHPRHLVLCRVRRALSRAARGLLAAAPDPKTAEQLVRAAGEVRATQRLFLPPGHLDLAESAEDLAVGLAALLSLDRQRLFEAFPADYGDFHKASGAEAALRKEAREIRGLYGKPEEGAAVPAASAEPAGVAPCAPAAAPAAKGGSEDWSIFD